VSEKIVRLRDGSAIVPEGEPDPDVVQLCEKLLEKARSGDLKVVAALCWNHIGDYRLETAGDIVVTKLVGLLEIAKVELAVKHLKIEGAL
jgi:hypothetical protein